MMNTSKHLLLCALLTLTLVLTGCAFTDRLLLSRETTPEGVELFIDNKTGEKTTSPTDATGAANQPAYSSAPAPAVVGATKLFGLIPGPWGELAMYGAGALATLYAALRAKGAMNAAKARAAAIKVGMALIMPIVQDVKAGVLDADKDGTVTLAEVAEYLKQKAIKSLTPEGVQGIIAIVRDALLTDAQKQTELEKIAAEL